MPGTSSNRRQIAAVVETTLGVTPTTPRMRQKVATSESLKYAPTFADSSEMRSDRMTSDSIRVGLDSGGGVNWEFHYPYPDSTADFDIRSAFFNSWINTPVRDNDTVADSVITDVGTIANTLTCTTGAAFVTGQLVRTTGFNNTSNNAIMRVATGGTTSFVSTGAFAIAESVPPASARAKVVGMQGTAGDFYTSPSSLRSIALDFTTMGLSIGQWISIGGTATAERFNEACNGRARIVGITQHILSLDNLPSGWTSDAGAGKTIKVWFGDMIANGITMLSQTIERGDLGMLTPVFIVQPGMVASGWSISIKPKAIITGSTTYIGMAGSQSTTTLDAVIDAAPSQVLFPQFAGSANIGRISENGVYLSTPNWCTGLDVSIANNIQPAESISGLGPQDLVPGECVVTGTLSTIFGSNALIARFFAGTPTSINIAVVKGNQSVHLTMPRVILNGDGNPNAGGKNQIIDVNFSFRASKDDALTGSIISMDRFEYAEIITPPTKGPGLDILFNNAVVPVDSRIVYTGSNGTYFDALGTLQQAATNVPRIDFGPMPGVTNYVRNNTATGAVAGTPGTTPTYWATNSQNTGLTPNIIGVGTENGIPYLDVQITGTSSGGQNNIQVDTGPLAQNGQTWTVSLYTKLVGGSLTNISGFNLLLIGNTGGGQIAMPNPTSASLGSQYRTYTTTLPSSGVTSLTLVGVQIASVAGAVNITLRIGGAQLELSAVANPWIPTVGAVGNSGAASDGITNRIRNSTMIGASAGTPGVLPTNWSQANNSGLAANVVGTGTEGGLPYIDLQFVGTATAGVTDVSFDTISAIAAVYGQTWTESFYARLVGGSTTNLTGIQSRCLEYTSAGVFVTGKLGGASLPGAGALATQRFTSALTWTGGLTTSFVQPQVEFVFTAGAVNVTIRIGAPQFEKATAASSFVPTYGVAVNVGAIPLGLLIEEQRTNLLLSSTNLAGTGWNVFGATATAASGIAPDGTNTAVLVSPSAQNGGPFQTSITVTGGTTYTLSVWLKRVSGNSAGIGPSYFDATHSTQYIGTSTITASWARYSYTFTTVAGTTSITPQILDHNTSGFGGFLAWGAQLELGAFPTSDIMTNSVAVTRTVDAASMSVGSLLNPLAGTLVTQANTPAPGAAGFFQCTAILDDNTLTNRIQLYRSAASVAFWAFDNATTSIFNQPIGTVSPGTPFSAGLSIDGVTTLTAFNGVGGTSGPGQVPPGLTTLRLGDVSSGGQTLNGYLRRVRYWPRALSGAELLAATT